MSKRCTSCLILLLAQLWDGSTPRRDAAPGSPHPATTRQLATSSTSPVSTGSRPEPAGQRHLCGGDADDPATMLTATGTAPSRNSGSTFLRVCDTWPPLKAGVYTLRGEKMPDVLVVVDGEHVQLAGPRELIHSL